MKGREEKSKKQKKDDFEFELALKVQKSKKAFDALAFFY